MLTLFHRLSSNVLSSVQMRSILIMYFHNGVISYPSIYKGHKGGVLRGVFDKISFAPIRYAPFFGAFVGAQLFAVRHMLDSVCAVGCVPLQLFSSLVTVRSNGVRKYFSQSICNSSLFCTDVQLSDYAI